MKIDIKDNSNESILKLCEYPLDCEYFGDEKNENDLKIFILQDTLDEVDEYLSGDLNNELGGVLLGDVCVNKDNGKFILINELITAKHSNSSLSRLTFTHETWDYINEVREKDFPEKKILGWFHSHPGHTVFLSNYDIFIQENFFNMYYMVAYVFDPTIKDRGFFLWRDNKVVKAGGFYEYGISKINEDDETNKVIKLNSSEDLLNSSDKEVLTKRNYEFKGAVTIGLLLLTLLILLFMIYNIYEIKQKALLKEEYIKDLNDIKNENRKLTDRLNDLVIESESRKSIKDGNNNTNTQEVTGSEISSSGNANLNAENISSNVTGKPSEENKKQETKESSTALAKYKVKSGDTLEKISNLFYKSRAGIELLMKHNNIKNKADIKIGQEIEIPVMEQH